MDAIHPLQKTMIGSDPDQSRVIRCLIEPDNLKYKGPTVGDRNTRLNNQGPLKILTLVRCLHYDS